MTTQVDRDRWRAAMQKMGRAGVQTKLLQVDFRSTHEVTGIGDRPPWPAQSDLEEWLNDQDIAAARRARIDRRWMIVGVTAAVIAAITGIISILR
jgi:hypothetical protein